MPLIVPDQTIAAQIPQGPDVMTRISSLLDIQNKRNQIQSGNIANQSNQANLDEENGVRSLMQNFDSYKGQDGNVDLNKFAPDILKAAPTKGAGIISAVVNAQRDGIAAKQSLAQLSQTQKSQLAQEVGSYANNGASPQENADRFNAFAQTMPNAQPIADYFHKYVMPQASADPKAASAAYLRAATSVMSPTEQVSANTPGGPAVSNGQQTAVINTNPLAPGVGAPIPGTPQQLQLPPNTPTNDPRTGNPMYLGSQPTSLPSPNVPSSPVGSGPGDIPKQTQPNTFAEGLDSSKMSSMQAQFLMRKDPAAFLRGIQHFQQTSQQAGQPGQQASPMNGGQMSGMTPGAVPAGAPLDTSELMGARTAANQAAASVGDSRSNNMQIKEVLKNTSNDFLDPTGKGASYLQGLSSTMGFSLGSDAASNYNSIAHNLALQQQTRNQQMGVKTDAGSAISAVSSGSPEQDRKTLTKAVNISDAGNAGIEMFNQGMESAIKSGGLPAIRAFKNAWSSNYDVSALRLVNAHANGDAQEAKEVIRLLGGPTSPQFKLARQHVINLELLSQGQLPGAK